jgi:hypothetical protein
MVTGTKDQRTRALLRPADVYLINYENLGWLAETLQTYFVKKDRLLPFNGIVWDEISKMKNSATNRVKAFRKIADKFDWTTGLTGTPASNGYKDLHGQFLVVDRGERLGISKTAFRTRFSRKVGPYKELPYEDTEDTIKKLIGDITDITSKEVWVVAAAVCPGILPDGLRRNILRAGSMGARLSWAAKVCRDEVGRTKTGGKLAVNPVNRLAAGGVKGSRVCVIRYRHG